MQTDAYLNTHIYIVMGVSRLTARGTLDMYEVINRHGNEHTSLKVQIGTDHIE